MKKVIKLIEFRCQVSRQQIQQEMQTAMSLSTVNKQVKYGLITKKPQGNSIIFPDFLHSTTYFLVVESLQPKYLKNQSCRFSAEKNRMMKTLCSLLTILLV